MSDTQKLSKKSKKVDSGIKEILVENWSLSESKLIFTPIESEFPEDERFYVETLTLKRLVSKGSDFKSNWVRVHEPV